MPDEDPTLSDVPPSSSAASDVTVRYPSPIGVPQYTIDPATGQVAMDQQGNPVPWFGSKPGGPTIPNVFAGTGGSMSTDYFAAQYNDGDEWAVVGSMPVEMRADVQQAMLDRGLFGAKKPNVALGSWDNESASAFKQVLAYANATGMDWQEALRDMPVVSADGLNPDGSQQVERGHYQIKLSNPADLAQVFKRAAADLIGGGDVPQEEIDKYVRAYQGLEKADQEAQIAAQEKAKRDVAVQEPIDQNVMGASLPDSAPVVSGAGDPVVTTTTNAPDPSTLAQQMIKEKFGGRVGATNVARAMDSFLSILGGGGASTQGTVV